MQTTAGHLLAGRLRYRQPVAGHRTGIEPVLLAAAVAPRAGELVLEAGAGAGAATLCLAARMAAAGVSFTGVAVERDAALAALAAANLAENGTRGLHVVVADVTQGAALAPARFHHAFANPPWHPSAASASPDGARDAARRAPVGTERLWAGALARTLVHHGTLTLILPAARLPAWIAALGTAGCGTMRLLPLWPRAGQAAKLVLLRAIRSGAGDCQILPGFALHLPDGSFTPESQAVLRGGEAISFG